MESKIQELVHCYFADEMIDGINVSDKRIIVTLNGAAENSEKADALKKALSDVCGERQISIIFTANKEAVSLRPEDEKWSVPSIKKLLRWRQAKEGSENRQLPLIWRWPCLNSGKKQLFLMRIFTARPCRPCWDMKISRLFLTMVKQCNRLKISA